MDNVNLVAKEARDLLKAAARKRRDDEIRFREPKREYFLSGKLVNTVPAPFRSRCELTETPKEYLGEKKRALYIGVHAMGIDLFRDLCSPGVYIFIDGPDVLYVGSSRRMMHRISHDSHESATRSAAEATEVLFLPCMSAARARLEEADLIKQLRPRYNIQGL